MTALQVKEYYVAFADKGQKRTACGLPPRREILFHRERTMEGIDLELLLKQTAHDVRTPLTTIGGFADLLASDNSLPAGARENAALIVAETKRLNDILEAFFARMTSKPDKA